MKTLYSKKKKKSLKEYLSPDVCDYQEIKAEIEKYLCFKILFILSVLLFFWIWMPAEVFSSTNHHRHHTSLLQNSYS